MKVLTRDFENHINADASVSLWNHFDHEHLTYIHSSSYTDCKILMEKEDMLVWLLSFRVPIFRFIISSSIGTVVLLERDTSGGGTLQQLNMGFLGIPSVTTVKVSATGKDKSMVRTNYKFLLYGWKQLLAPLLYRMLPSWNAQVWSEDLALRMRRHKVLRCGFRDFVGMPEKVADRKNEGRLTARIPLPRVKESPVNEYLNTFLAPPGQALEVLRALHNASELGSSGLIGPEPPAIPSEELELSKIGS